MGYMTTVTFLNDGGDVFEKNPKQVVQNILDAMNNLGPSQGVQSMSVGNFANPMQIAPSHHADHARVYITQGNLMVELGYFNNVQKLEVREKYLEMAKKAILEEEEEIKRLKAKKNK